LASAGRWHEAHTYDPGETPFNSRSVVIVGVNEHHWTTAAYASEFKAGRRDRHSWSGRKRSSFMIDPDRKLQIR
jgi:hypothetical protein